MRKKTIKPKDIELKALRWKVAFLEKANSPEMKRLEEKYYKNIAYYQCGRYDLMKI